MASDKKVTHIMEPVVTERYAKTILLTWLHYTLYVQIKHVFSPKRLINVLSLNEAVHLGSLKL